jgi:outer membrane protein OmpA-like peptidoglycan-associated protein
LVTVVMLIGPAWLASWLGWPLGEHTTLTWFWQYLRGGTVPDEAVIAVLVVILWGLWAAHLVVVALDIVALLRGLVPRVGLVRLVWVLAAGGATATSTHTAAVAAPTDTVAEATARPGLGSQEGLTPENRDEEQEIGVIDRTRNLSGFAFDSDQLSPQMKESLEPTIAMISDFGLPEAPVVVTGHTDPLGDPYYNRVLSEQRAQAVADYLAEHLGEDVEFEIQGAGSSQPPEDSQASYGEHRRVEITYTLQRPAAPASETSGEADQPWTRSPIPNRLNWTSTPKASEALAPTWSWSAPQPGWPVRVWGTWPDADTTPLGADSPHPRPTLLNVGMGRTWQRRAPRTPSPAPASCSARTRTGSPAVPSTRTAICSWPTQFG